MEFDKMNTNGANDANDANDAKSETDTNSESEINDTNDTTLNSFEDFLKNIATPNSNNNENSNENTNEISNENKKRNLNKMNVSDLKTLVVAENLIDNENAQKLKKNELLKLLQKN